MTTETADNTVQTYKPAPLVFTQAAAYQVAKLVAQEKNLALMLRVFLTGGGCGGFQYGFTFDEIVNDDDTVIERTVTLPAGEEGVETDMTIQVKVLVDPMSFQYLVGAEIDYKEDLSGAQFVIRNPNAKTTCGCGSSFSV
ncbi:MAG: iron-sulfur cluster insertion protein ErpA [Gammaproteobacteria bacterium RIFCSPHIGHO2_12_FULL_35_23]|nr:MAG: iron-sulfur cluster insertion protein ErpA [Gammaproteobacteria bacterium RIFCSPHIGHO2_12_FULL_35_23]